jgi:toxin ParE1/3/4
MPKTFRVVFRPSAEDDLTRLHDYIAGEAGRNRAGAYIDRLANACFDLSLFPMRGTLRQDIEPGLRLVGFERRAVIAFRVLEWEVEIVHVLYGGQDIEARFGNRH